MDQGADLGTIVDRLVADYPATNRTVVQALLVEALSTVRRMSGRHDADMAEDLVRLRLDIRSRAH